MRFLASRRAAGSWRWKRGMKEWLAVSSVGTPCWASAGWLVSAWSGQTRYSGDSVQRGRTGVASAQSITISQRTRCVLCFVFRAERNAGAGAGAGAGGRMADTRNARDRRSAPVVRRPEVPLSEQRLRVGARTPCKACGCCAKGERGCATGVGVRVTARLSCFDAGERRQARDWREARRTGAEGVATAGVGESVNGSGAIERPLRRSRNRNRRTRWYMAKAKGAYA